MGSNLSIQMGYLNFEFAQKQQGQNIAMQNSAATSQSAINIVKQPLFIGTNNYTLPHIDVIQASAQITLNNSLKETIKYLKQHKNKAKKKPILGELTTVLEKEIDENNSVLELKNYEIDFNAKNIFAA